MSIPSLSSASSAKPTPGAGLISALGGGSGVDVSALASSLVEAERAPQQALIDTAIKTTQARISGYGAVLSSLSAFKGSLAALQDQSKLNSPAVQSNGAGYFEVSASATATPGRHRINVLSLAMGQSSISAGFSSSTTILNGGAPITLDLTVGGQAISPALVISGSDPAGASPNDIVSAINNANAGISAQLVNTGAASNPHKIVITSTTTGSGATFSIATSATAADGVTPLDFSTALQAAADAHLLVDGVDMLRSTNTVSDAIPGVRLTLLAPTSTDGTLANSVAGSIDISRDTASVKANVQALVVAFNSLKGLLGTVSDGRSTVADTGATLVNDSLVRQIQRQITQMMTDNSSTPGDNGVSALRDLGVTIQRDGTLALDQTQLDAVLKNQFPSVVKMLTANKENSKGILSGSRGLAGDAVTRLTGLMAQDGPIVMSSNNASAKISTYNQKRVALEERMQALLNQYTNQFAAMERMVGQLNSLKISLGNQFTAWANQKD